MERLEKTIFDWQSLCVGLMFCYEGEVNLLSHGTHDVPGATAWLVQRGWAQVTDEAGHSVRADAGQWLMVRPGIRTQSFSEDVQLLSINFRAAFHTGENIFDQGLSLAVSNASFPMLEKRARELLKVSKRVLLDKDTRYAITAPVELDGYLSLQRAVLDWVRSWSRCLLAMGLRPLEQCSSDSRVQQALSHLRQEIRDPNLDLSKIAALVGLSLSQLNRQFIRERGETVRQAHHKHLTEGAKELLMRSTMSIKEISTDLGFRHQSHFGKWFLHQTGMTPTAFRSNPIRSRFFAEVRSR